MAWWQRAAALAPMAAVEPDRALLDSRIEFASVTRPPLDVESSGSPRLAPKLGLFDATMMVMGGIAGAGVFMNPYRDDFLKCRTISGSAWAVIRS